MQSRPAPVPFPNGSSKSQKPLLSLQTGVVFQIPRARIEVLPDEFQRLLQDDMAKRIYQTLLGLGFTYVTFNLGGYQSGSMNKTL